LRRAPLSLLPHPVLCDDRTFFFSCASRFFSDSATEGLVAFFLPLQDFYDSSNPPGFVARPVLWRSPPANPILSFLATFRVLPFDPFPVASFHFFQVDTQRGRPPFFFCRIFVFPLPPGLLFFSLLSSSFFHCFSDFAAPFPGRPVPFFPQRGFPSLVSSVFLGFSLFLRGPSRLLLPEFSLFPDPPFPFPFESTSLVFFYMTTKRCP